MGSGSGRAGDWREGSFWYPWEGDMDYWQKTDRGLLQCTLCNHACKLKDGQDGICGVRRRRGDVIESLVYGRVIAENVDPIEKKPLFHVLPGSLSYSIATAGCNFHCRHCQNASISQVDGNISRFIRGARREPEQIVAAALASGCRSISYTYVEPTVFFEYAYDCCREAQQHGLLNAFVSNGYMTGTVITQLAPVLAAINIDIKSFRNDFYRDICGAKLAPVLEAVAMFRERGVWVEVTTLVIPTMNDSEEELRDIAKFLVSVDKDIPWHVTGFYPTYKMTQLPPTDPAALSWARQLGLAEGLRFVYTGNRPGEGNENTYCPACGTELIGRLGLRVRKNRLDGGRCPDCHELLAGLWG
jgi:pyruvate formate lyase activating enzyme